MGLGHVRVFLFGLIKKVMEKSMQPIKAYALVLLSILIGSGTVLVLVPVTLLWLLGVALVIGGGVFGMALGVMEMSMPSGFLEWIQVTLAIVLLPGYGLISLLWMVFSHRTVTFREVPKKIWLGLAVGCVYAVFFSGLHRFRLTTSPPFITYQGVWNDWTLRLYVGMAPLLILFCTLLAMWLRGQGAANQCLPSEEQVVNQ